MEVDQSQALAPEDSRGEARRKFRLIAGLLLVLATLAVYNPISRAPYLNYDDNAYVYENFHVRAGLKWDTVVWAFTTSAESNWHPITWLSHALDVEIFGLNPAGPHYVNVLIHSLNAVLLFLLLEAATGLAWRSLAAAAMFALHPINVESVAWISERKNVLSMFFFLLALAAYGRYCRKPGIGRYALVCVCFAMGLMAKPQVITFPFALLLLDYWPLKRVDAPDREGARSWPRLFAEKIPLFALAAASAWVTMRAQTSAMHAEYPLVVRLENAALAYAKYIGKTVWPNGLAPLYPHPGLSVNAAHTLLAALLLVAITAAAWFSRRGYAIVGWLWFLAILVPMIGLVQVGVQAMADRYAYIPLIGIFVIVSWSVGDLVECLHMPRAVAGGAASVLLVTLTFMTHRQVNFWKDNLTLWTHTLAVTQHNFIAEDSVAEFLLTQGKNEEAAKHLQRAVEINPQDPMANLNLGAYEQQRGNYAEAITRYQNVVRFTQNPRLVATALTNLGYAFYSRKQFAEAKNSFESALQQNPQNPQALLGLGLVAQMSGNFPQACDEYSRALRLQPSDVGYLLLAQGLEKIGESAGSHQAHVAAERISKNLNAAQQATDRLLSP